MKIEHVGGNIFIEPERRGMDDVFAAVNQVEAYWSALAARAAAAASASGGAAAEQPPLPARAQIDPRGIESALAQAFILERIAPRVARFRLAGSHLADLMGMEVRGMPLTALFQPDARWQAGDATEHAFAGPARIWLDLKGEGGIGRAPLTARMILLPLTDAEGRVTRVLGALEAKGAIGRQPRRFAIAGSRSADLGDGALTAAPVQTTPGLAEAAGRTAWHHRPGRPALRVIHNDAGKAESPASSER